VSGTLAPAATDAISRRVEHVMGMPISLALRGRHAHDERGEAAWQAALEVLHEADRVFSPYRNDSVVSRLARHELTTEECPEEVREVLALGERAREQSGGAFDVRRPSPGGGTVLDPSGVVKGWAVDRAARVFDVLPDTDVCLSAGGDLVCRTVMAGSPAGGSGSNTRTIRPGSSPLSRSGTERWPRRGWPTAEPTSSTPAPGGQPAELASVTVVGPDLVWADIDATAAFALGADALDMAAWAQAPERAGGVGGRQHGAVRRGELS
jgi:thiamine biosynthesis lipoprotein